MISPEVLRRFPFFSFMRHDQLSEVAMITDEVKMSVKVGIGDVTSGERRVQACGDAQGGLIHATDHDLQPGRPRH
ncbi:MAG: hypothetical protein ACK2UH_14685, partial [Candidatus Promineifilaceae bacterium]